MNLINKQNKVVVYTINLGLKDKVLDPAIVDNDVDYLCFSDCPSRIDTKIYKLVYCDPDNFIHYNDDPYTNYSRASKPHKICPHKIPELQKYNLSIYHDASIQIKRSLRPLIIEASENLFSAFWHGRGGLYLEANANIMYNKDYHNIIWNQIDRYNKEGYPRSSKNLYITGVLFRKHMKAKVIELSELWMKEIENGTHRCQVSLPYAEWKLDFPIYVFNGEKFNYRRNQFENNYFFLYDHLIKSEIKKEKA